MNDLNDINLRRALKDLKSSKSLAPDTEFKINLKKSILNEIEDQKILDGRKRFRSSIFDSKFIRLGPIALIFFILLLGGTVYAAQNSKPNDFLFPVKKLSENSVKKLAPSALKETIEKQINKIEDKKDQEPNESEKNEEIENQENKSGRQENSMQGAEDSSHKGENKGKNETESEEQNRREDHRDNLSPTPTTTNNNQGPSRQVSPTQHTKEEPNSTEEITPTPSSSSEK